jgi:hypothetical protein
LQQERKVSARESAMSRKPAIDQNQLAFTVDQFCHYHNLSRPFFYKVLKAGIGPRIFKVGTLVSTEAAAAWRREREAATRNVAA